MNKKRGAPTISGAGRTIQYTLTITPEDAAYLLAINPQISKAIRQIVKERKASRHDN